jgi:hypothetical protein
MVVYVTREASVVVDVYRGLHVVFMVVTDNAVNFDLKFALSLGLELGLP